MIDELVPRMEDILRIKVIQRSVKHMNYKLEQLLKRLEQLSLMVISINKLVININKLVINILVVDRLIKLKVIPKIYKLFLTATG